MKLRRNEQIRKIRNNIRSLVYRQWVYMDVELTVKDKCHYKSADLAQVL